MTDKRIRALEKERVRRGKSFEAVYRKYQKERIHHSETHLIAKYGLKRSEAKALRKEALKEGVPVKKILPPPKPPPQPGQMPYTSNWVDFRRDFVDLIKKQQKGEGVDPDFVFIISFGELQYSGTLEGFPQSEYREHGDDLYGLEDSPPWLMWIGLIEGFTYYEKRKGEIVKTRLEVVVDSKASGDAK